MADLAATTVTLATPAILENIDVAATVSGDTAPIGDDLMLFIKNGAGTTTTVTIATPGTVDGLAIADVSIAIPTLLSALVPLTQPLASGATGRANITYSQVTTVTVAVLRVRR
jgi:hypothetical protein